MYEGPVYTFQFLVALETITGELDVLRFVGFFGGRLGQGTCIRLERVADWHV
jgi:hypothetical protein